MGVDYDASGGIGIRITEEVLSILGYNSDDISIDEFIDSFGITYTSYGNCYTEEINYAWVMKERNFLKCIEQADDWINELNRALNHKYSLNKEDLEVIVEYCIS